MKFLTITERGGNGTKLYWSKEMTPEGNMNSQEQMKKNTNGK